jgi:hypothetical protein
MKALWVLLSVTFLAAFAPAATVTFDGYSPLDTCMSSISSEGPTFSAPVDCSSTYQYVWDGSSPSGNGTPALTYGFNPNPVAITQTGGGAFTLNDLQMTLSWYDALPSEDITLTAFFQGDGSTTQTLTLIQGLPPLDRGSHYDCAGTEPRATATGCPNL